MARLLRGSYKPDCKWRLWLASVETLRADHARLANGRTINCKPFFKVTVSMGQPPSIQHPKST
jgi:hypothetical protein